MLDVVDVVVNESGEMGGRRLLRARGQRWDVSSNQLLMGVVIAAGRPTVSKWTTPFVIFAIFFFATFSRAAEMGPGPLGPPLSFKTLPLSNKYRPDFDSFLSWTPEMEMGDEFCWCWCWRMRLHGLLSLFHFLFWYFPIVSQQLAP